MCASRQSEEAFVKDAVRRALERSARDMPVIEILIQHNKSDLIANGELRCKLALHQLRQAAPDQTLTRAVVLDLISQQIDYRFVIEQLRAAIVKLAPQVVGDWFSDRQAPLSPQERAEFAQREAQTYAGMKSRQARDGNSDSEGAETRGTS